MKVGYEVTTHMHSYKRTVLLPLEMWKLVLLLVLYKTAPANGLPNETDTGCVLNITGSQNFTECVMGYLMFITDASNFTGLSDPLCSTEGKAVMQCIFEYINSCPDLLGSGNFSSSLQGFQTIEQFGGLEAYCNNTPAFVPIPRCIIDIAENESFIECIRGYAMLISFSSSFIDLNDPNAKMAVTCSTEGQAAMQCVSGHVQSCPELMQSVNTSSVLHDLHEIEQVGGLESFCNSSSALSLSHGCAPDIAGNQTFIECVMGYSTVMSNATYFMDLNDPNSITSIMCSSEGQAAMRCLLEYVNACPDLINSGNSSSILQDLQALGQFGLETFCNTTSAGGMPHGCTLDIAGDQSFTECVMRYSMFMSIAASFVDVNDPNEMKTIMCSTEGQAAMQCVLEYVTSCPDLMSSGNSSSNTMFQDLQILEQFGGLESYCNSTSAVGLPYGCALDVAGNQSFIECVTGYSMYMSNVTNFLDPNDPNAMTAILCSMEGKMVLQCVLEYVESCPDLMNIENASSMMQGLQTLEQLGGLEAYCNNTSEADECVDETDNCSENAFCTNTVWGYTCTCDATKGFYGDGTSCSQVICNPDDSIDIYNLSADYYYFAMQNVTGGPDVQCTVTNINSTAVTITGCAKDLPILLTFGTYRGMEANRIHGGKSVIAVMIKCIEIPETGNLHSIRNMFNVSLRVDEKAYIKPHYEVTSALNTTSATVGSPVKWTIGFPLEYILEVTECKAFPGTSNTSSNFVTLVSNGGCNATSELISHFTDNLDGTASSTIAAFKFHDDDNIFLTCDLKICPNASSSCNTLCSREKRSVKQIPEAREKEATEARAATVHSVLKIVDNSASAPTLFSGWFILTLTLIAGAYSDNNMCLRLHHLGQAI